MGSPEALTDAHFGEGVGPIFLDKLRCTRNEESLLSCRRGEPLGLSRCSHSQDVSVRCPGEPIVLCCLMKKRNILNVSCSLLQILMNVLHIPAMTMPLVVIYLVTLHVSAIQAIQGMDLIAQVCFHSDKTDTILHTLL